jgi:hypothetical protein
MVASKKKLQCDCTWRIAMRTYELRRRAKKTCLEQLLWRCPTREDLVFECRYRIVSTSAVFSVTYLSWTMGLFGVIMQVLEVLLACRDSLFIFATKDTRLGSFAAGMHFEHFGAIQTG